MSIQSILLPVFVLVLLAFFLMSWTIKERMTGKRVATAGPDVASRDAWAGKAQQVGNCLQNQFELPPLFFILVVLAIITKKADVTFVVMEWLFVLSRLGHAFIFTTTNNLQQRGGVFALGYLVLFLMWVIFAVRILFQPSFGAL